MSETKDPAWPKTPEGVTDWEFVFEDSSRGFIPLILMAHSGLVLKECTTIVIQQLFTRDDDGMHIMKYVIALDEIIPDSLEKSTDKNTLKSMHTETATLLRKIKKDRLEQVKVFLKNKDKMTPDRRQ